MILLFYLDYKIFKFARNMKAYTKRKKELFGDLIFKVFNKTYVKNRFKDRYNKKIIFPSLHIQNNLHI